MCPEQTQTGQQFLFEYMRYIDLNWHYDDFQQRNRFAGDIWAVCVQTDKIYKFKISLNFTALSQI